MKQKWAVYLAALLLVAAGTVDGWDWWLCHDVEILSMFQRVPVVGSSVRAAFGDDTWKQSMTIAVDASYPPFASLDQNGKMVGFEVDLASELGKRLCANPRLVNMDAGDALFDALAAKKVDAIIAGLTYYPDVTRDVAYSDPYFEAGPVLLAKGSRDDIRSVEDLAGKRVAVEMGSLGEEEARKRQRSLDRMTVVPMDDVAHVIASVGNGAADAAIVDRPSIPPGSLAAAGLKVVGPPLRTQPYMVAVRRQDRSLVLAIDHELDLMKADGSLAEMEKRWFK